jgi:hypothetical protein
MDFCPAYWDWLDQEFATRRLLSISSVYDELTSSKDELTDWVKVRKEHFTSVADKQTQDKYVDVVEHVYGLENKNPVHIANFLDKADPWLISKACVINATIVTHERLDPPNSKKVKIPNVAQHFGVECISTFTLLKEMKVKFTLA